ncbi:hypothetical protein PENTCL1PPCAC_8423, partial [Pristionchus entomophagus]
ISQCYRGKQRRFLEVMNSLNDMSEYYAPWGSPALVKRAYVYMTNGKSLFTIDPATAKMLPPFHFFDVDSFYIAGIHGGKLTGRGRCKKSGKYHMMTADLPYEYVAMVQSIPAVPSAIDTANGGFTSKFENEFDVKKIRGEGGFGCVFEAVNKYDKWEYAVKRIAIDVRDEESALREVVAMAQFDHPNIIRYNASWVEKPPEGWQNYKDVELLAKLELSKRSLAMFRSDCAFIYIQMQLANYSLSDWLNNNRESASRSLPRMKMWFKQMVSAVEYIHSKNLIHRDLKPSNVLFVEQDVLKLCDLGIVTARRYDEESDSEFTRTSTGTKLYMSPEQRLWFRYSSRSDVFSLGLIFAELCIVMNATERNDIFDNIRQGKQNKLDDLITDCKTVELIKMLTQVESKDRPSSREMIDHLFLA